MVKDQLSWVVRSWKNSIKLVSRLNTSPVQRTTADKRDKLRAASELSEVVMVWQLGYCGLENMNGEFDRISHGGKVLKDTTAMTAER